MAGLYHEFLAHIKDTGVAKTSHFQVSIPTVPGSLSAKFPGYGRLLSFRCEGTDLPGRQLATQDSRVYGPVYKTPYQSIYQDITLNFIETGDFFIRQFFEAWIDGIFDSSNNSLSYPNTYRTDISITQFDMTTGSKESTELAQLATWHLFNAFPTAANQMPVAWTEDGFHRVSISFSYEYYTISKPTAPKKQLSRPTPISPANQGGLSGGTT